jgi:hypothetical protein
MVYYELKYRMGVFTELCLPYIFLETIYACLLGYFSQIGKGGEERSHLYTLDSLRGISFFCRGLSSQRCFYPVLKFDGQLSID